MAARAGIEPALGLLQACFDLFSYESSRKQSAAIGAQEIARLEEVVRVWAGLSRQLQDAIVSVVRSASGGAL